MAIPDVPEENRLAESVVRCLGEGAGARDGAATIVEPVSNDVPVGNLGHLRPHSIRLTIRHRPRLCREANISRQLFAGRKMESEFEREPGGGDPSATSQFSAGVRLTGGGPPIQPCLDALRDPYFINNFASDDEPVENLAMPPFQHLSRRRPRTTRCQRCKTKIKIKGRGRVPRFCSPTCRQLAYEQRKWQRPAPVESLARDLATVKVRDFIRAEIWSQLQAAGLIAPNQPPPLPPKARQKPTHLRVVEPRSSDER